MRTRHRRTGCGRRSTARATPGRSSRHRGRAPHAPAGAPTRLGPAPPRRPAAAPGRGRGTRRAGPRGGDSWEDVTGPRSRRRPGRWGLGTPGPPGALRLHRHDTSSRLLAAAGSVVLVLTVLGRVVGPWVGRTLVLFGSDRVVDSRSGDLVPFADVVAAGSTTHLLPVVSAVVAGQALAVRVHAPGDDPAAAADPPRRRWWPWPAPTTPCCCSTLSGTTRAGDPVSWNRCGAPWSATWTPRPRPASAGTCPRRPPRTPNRRRAGVPLAGAGRRGGARVGSPRDGHPEPPVRRGGTGRGAVAQSVRAGDS